MAEIRGKLRELLENHELQEALATAFATGIDVPEQFESIDLADHIRHARGIGVDDTPFVDVATNLKDVLDSLVIERLPEPQPITTDDLRSLAVSHLAGIQLSDEHAWRNAYTRFIYFALSELGQQRQANGCFELGEEWELDPDDEKSFPYAPGDRYDFVIWSSDTGFRLHGWATAAYYDECTVRGQLTGFCSEGAMGHAGDHLNDVIESIARSVKLCSELEDYNVGFLINGRGQLMMSTCISAIWKRPETASDELLNRLRNAVVLLSQADKIESEPVALSLSFAAIEALVCEEGGLTAGPTQQVKHLTATRLVQDSLIRKRKEKVIDKLYNIRSRVLHGSKVDWPHAGLIYWQARTIAAAVILAVACWREHHLRVPGPATWKELMDELNAASRKPGEVVGVPDFSELIPDKVPG
jgi:hypothetical protein